jgi:hypothetical protein
MLVGPCENARASGTARQLPVKFEMAVPLQGAGTHRVATDPSQADEVVESGELRWMVRNWH